VGYSIFAENQAALDKLLKRPQRARMSPMRRVAVFALIVAAALIALATIHFSKGEPLPTPSSMVTVRPDTR
jgi:hypothetical protein